MKALLSFVCTAMVLTCVIAAEAEDEKDMEPLSWFGGKTIDPRSGEPHHNGLATRVQMEGKWAFLAIPKLKPDVQSTCAKLDMTRKIGEEPNFVLTPFPPNEPTDPQSPKRLQSVVDLCIDHLNSLWVLDVGAIYPPKNPDDPTPVICPPKICAYHTVDGKLRHEINLMQYVTQTSRLQFMNVDHSKDGHPFVYISDAGSKALIVCDINHNTCHRVPLPEDVISEYAPRDVLYTFLIRNAEGNNKLYFTYRSGDTLWCVNTEDLQQDKSCDKAWVVGKKDDKLIFLGTDDWTHVYCRYEKNQKEIHKWDTDTEFDRKNFILVHKSHSDNMIPTHAMADYKNGVMRVCLGNLIDYLKQDTQAKDAKNTLEVMAIGDEASPSSSEPLGHTGMREL